MEYIDFEKMFGDRVEPDNFSYENKSNNGILIGLSIL